MKRPICIILGLFYFFSVPQAYGKQLSPQARISLLTAGPGTELYSVFGHSAVRVSDPDYGIDEVYNYGTFDFDTPNFYLKFIRGQLLYQLSVSSMAQFLFDYKQEQRAVYEQAILLNQVEKQSIYDFLQWNRLPENRAYLYDFFYDNCATRIRDLIDTHLSIDWGPDPFPGPKRTFRDMLQPYVSRMPWAAFGIDLALGLPADQLATPWHYMFLPDEMFVAFAQARHSDGRPLTGPHTIVLQETPSPQPKPLLNPMLVMWIVFASGLLSLLKPRISLWFDRIFFFSLGLIGLVVVFLLVFSEHVPTKQNMVLLWALPTHLYFVFRLKQTKNIPTGDPIIPGSYGWIRRLFKVRSAIQVNPFAYYYFRFVALLCLLLLVLWPWIPQGFHQAFFPLVLLTAIKAALVRSGKKKCPADCAD